MGFLADGTGGKRKAHVLIVRSPFAGHCGPFLQILYLLEAKYPGLRVTYVADKVRIGDVTDLQSRGELRNLDLRTEALFGDTPLYLEDPRVPFRASLVAEQHIKECDSWGKKLLTEKGAPGQPTVVLADFIEHWSKDLAEKLGIPWYVYFSASPLFVLNFVYAPRLTDAGYIPDPTASNQSVIIENFPGFSSIRVRDQFDDIFAKAEYYVQLLQNMRESAAVLLNTQDDLDRPAGTVEVLRNLLPSTRVMTMGPSIQMPGFGVVFSRTESACLNWLDGQPENSVLYVAFGTLGIVSKEEMFELAAGIETSGVRFLWAIRVGSPDQLLEVLPPGFLERTKERGLVETKWVPQTKVLSHQSTAGFLSHSGWNSTLESICAGVPMISWPLGADQPYISRYIHHIAKIGIAICYAKGDDHDTFDDIDRNDVKKTIGRLMSNSEEGHQLKTNVQELQKLVSTSMTKGGSSYQQINAFLSELVNA